MAIPFKLQDSSSRNITSVNDMHNEQYIGLKMPLQNSEHSGSLGYFESTVYSIDAIVENVKNLLITQKGERIFHLGMGVNWNKFLFEPFTSKTTVALKSEIMQSLVGYMPFLHIRECQIANNLNGQENIIYVLLIIEYGGDTVPIEFQMRGTADGPSGAY